MTMANDYPTASDELPPNAIAVIGMAGRFPGADSVTTFWDNLRRGEESIATLSEEALTAAGVSAKTLADPAYVRRAPLLDGIEEFDAEYFGMTPYTARMMDPQQRLFLQTAWHAFEDSGYDPATFDGAIGVFAASTASGYLMDNLMSHRNPKALVGEGITVEMFNLVLLNDKDYLATRVSHQFNLRGPSLSVQTACSSSLVAVHLACQSLLSGECEMVLAGAASIRVPHQVGYTYEPGAMVSASGHCRPFDVRSDGTIFGSGVAAVILKPLQAAIDDGDRIHAVIRGSAINNDGSVKMTYAAPALAGQAEVIAEAHAVAGVDASTIGFVETHGRSETESQIADLEVVPRLRISYRGVTLEEMDVDAVIARHAGIALVDELAHTNVPGSRNEKRWQDVILLLDEGINVISAVNVQHLESLNDVIQRTLGVTVRETVPDWIIGQADQVVNLDISAEDLRQRLHDGKIYRPDKVQAALANFFTDENLTTLRELALREVASSVDRSREAIARREENGGTVLPRKTVDRVMACMSSDPPLSRVLDRDPPLLL